MFTFIARAAQEMRDADGEVFKMKFSRLPCESKEHFDKLTTMMFQGSQILSTSEHTKPPGIGFLLGEIFLFAPIFIFKVFSVLPLVLTVRLLVLYVFG
jgi:hypothetical protein